MNQEQERDPKLVELESKIIELQKEYGYKIVAILRSNNQAIFAEIGFQKDAPKETPSTDDLAN